MPTVTHSVRDIASETFAEMDEQARAEQVQSILQEQPVERVEQVGGGSGYVKFEFSARLDKVSPDLSYTGEIKGEVSVNATTTGLDKTPYDAKVFVEASHSPSDDDAPQEWKLENALRSTVFPIAEQLEQEL